MTEPQTHDPEALRERAALHYRAGDLLIDVGRQRVMRDDQTIALPKLSFDLLVALARAAPNLVSSATLLQQVWPKVVVGPETLNQRVKLVRDALGDDPRHPRYVEGLRGRGYRLIPPVEIRFVAVAAAVSAEAAAAESPDVGAVKAAATERGGSAPLAAALPARPSARLGRRPWRVRGLWLTSLLLALLGGTVVPAPWRQVTSTLIPEIARPVPVPPQTIAVLPFDNLGPSMHDDYLALGVAGAVLHQLAGDPKLTVVARSSSFSLGAPAPDAREVGRRLGVRYVVEGSVQHAGSLLRVTAQLIDARTNRELWSTQLDRDFGAIFALQDQISAQVAREVEATLHAAASSRRLRARSPGIG